MRLITVGSYTEPYQAHLARSLLESNGISAFVLHEHHIGVNWLYSSALGGVKVQVASETAEAAIGVLNRELHDSPESSPESDEVEGESHCPACGGSRITPTRLERRTKAVSMLVGLPFVIGRDQWKCETCGERWRRSFSYRRPDHVLADLTALSVSALLWILLIPLRFVQRFVGLRIRAVRWTYPCWKCGSEVRPSEPVCGECSAVLPDSTAFREIIDPGKEYDAQCMDCHTPYAYRDYDPGAVTWRCSRCGEPVPRGE